MRRSVEDVEIYKIKIRRLVETAMTFYDALTDYQMEVIDPITREPFCMKCGDSIKDRIWNGHSWRCDKCKLLIRHEVMKRHLEKKRGDNQLDKKHGSI